MKRPVVPFPVSRESLSTDIATGYYAISSQQAKKYPVTPTARGISLLNRRVDAISNVELTAMYGAAAHPRRWRALRVLRGIRANTGRSANEKGQRQAA